ncbi:MAG: TIGR00282 family metallophosphoesterase [Fimbriimonadales bacterium]|nr:TIGR00282 family metallophosphoesterase [Fimbriimonadales bacterium]
MLTILFLGDIVGRVGRHSALTSLPKLRELYDPDFILANAENAAAGFGITPDIAEELLTAGIDMLTLGNHAFHRPEICEYLNETERVLRPANFPPNTPGKGVGVLSKNGKTLAVLNLIGRVFIGEYDDPFRTADTLLNQIQPSNPHAILIDFHAEATSEKQALAHYLDGRVSAIIGTHTHVQTADNQILPKGTAYISDAGMCGPTQSIIGMEISTVLKRFLTLMPTRFEVAKGPATLSAVVVKVNGTTRQAQSIDRILWQNIPELPGG